MKKGKIWLDFKRTLFPLLVPYEACNQGEISIMMSTILLKSYKICISNKSCLNVITNYPVKAPMILTPDLGQAHEACGGIQCVLLQHLRMI